MEFVKLNNGVEMPILGTGTNTFGMIDNKYQGGLSGKAEEVVWAVENGYEHFDTAQTYGTEGVVAQGIRESGKNREDFFITTKLDSKEGRYHGVEYAHEAIKKSLELLDTDYIDLFLIHWPWDNQDEMVEAWKILEEYYDKGVFKAIGVSNFQREDLDLILEHGNVVPAANQIESHMGHWNDELIAYNQEKGIQTIAWSPLRGIKNESEGFSTLEEVAQAHGKTPAQVVLRYQIQRGVAVIPKSHNKGRQATNIDVFDFELTDEEMEKVSKL